MLPIPAALGAQGWAVQAAAGRAISDPVSARVGSNVASLGVEYGDSAARWLYLTAGTPLGGNAPSWLAGGAGTWLGVDRGEWTLGASLGAHGFGFGAADSVSSGGGASAEVMPTFTLSRGSLRTELASGVVGAADFGGDSLSPGSRVVSASHARLIGTVAPGVELSGEARYLHSRDGGFPYAGAALEGQHGRYGGWVYAGRWLKDDFPAPKTAYGAGASVRFRRMRLEAAVRQEPLDPVYPGTPRRSWTVQLSQGFGRVPRAPWPAGGEELPPPSLAPVVTAGVATFRLPQADYPQPPELVGDFNCWEPLAMTAQDGYWTSSVQLAPGVHHYAYRVGDGTFFVPQGVPAVDDGFGGVSAVLVVP
ncbi:MAG TPA: glycogen-binding domain-containing protein [Longimicrobium sp.]|nr:glycogen-binding domain-containing protein [Longimicrobium sp.]